MNIIIPGPRVSASGVDPHTHTTPSGPRYPRVSRAAAETAAQSPERILKQTDPYLCYHVVIGHLPSVQQGAASPAGGWIRTTPPQPGWVVFTSTDNQRHLRPDWAPSERRRETLERVQLLGTLLIPDRLLSGNLTLLRLKTLTISTFVRRRRNDNTSLSVSLSVRMFTELG